MKQELVTIESFLLLVAIGYMFFLSWQIDGVYKWNQAMLNEINEKHEVSDIEFIDILSRKFAAAHNYSRENYNCVNYSNDYSFIMESLGFDAELRRGYPDNGSVGHRWVKLCIDIEPQDGTPAKWGCTRYPTQLTEDFLLKR